VTKLRFGNTWRQQCDANAVHFLQRRQQHHSSVVEHDIARSVRIDELAAQASMSAAATKARRNSAANIHAFSQRHRFAMCKFFGELKSAAELFNLSAHLRAPS